MENKLKTESFILRTYEEKDFWTEDMVWTKTDYIPSIEKDKVFEPLINAMGYQEEGLKEGMINQCYVLRTKDSKDSKPLFECGIDLTTDRKFWIGLSGYRDKTFDNYKDMENFFNDKFPLGWVIEQEEYFTK